MCSLSNCLLLLDIYLINNWSRYRLKSPELPEQSSSSSLISNHFVSNLINPSFKIPPTFSFIIVFKPLLTHVCIIIIKHLIGFPDSASNYSHLKGSIFLKHHSGLTYLSLKQSIKPTALSSKLLGLQIPINLTSIPPPLLLFHLQTQSHMSAFYSPLHPPPSVVLSAYAFPPPHKYLTLFPLQWPVQNQGPIQITYSTNNFPK